VLCSEESVRVEMEERVKPFSIKKRINAELFIDRMAVLYIGGTRIRVGIIQWHWPIGG